MSFFCEQCESQSFEYLDYRQGEMMWKCRECFTVKYDYQDCNGG